LPEHPVSPKYSTYLSPFILNFKLWYIVLLHFSFFSIVLLSLHSPQETPERSPERSGAGMGVEARFPTGVIILVMGLVVGLTAMLALGVAGAIATRPLVTPR
jgi:hypothetical protein